MINLIHVVPTHAFQNIKKYISYILFTISWPPLPIHATHHLKKNEENFSIVPRGIKSFDQSESSILPLFSNFGAGPGLQKKDTKKARPNKVCCAFVFVVSPCALWVVLCFCFLLLFFIYIFAFAFALCAFVLIAFAFLLSLLALLLFCFCFRFYLFSFGFTFASVSIFAFAFALYF